MHVVTPAPISGNRASPNLEIALELARMGAYVFPCQSEGEHKKAPCRGVWWLKVSTRDERDIRALWYRYPDAVPGIDLAKSGWFVVDCDKKLNDGLAWFTAYAGRHDDALDACPVVDTPSGGRHHFYRNTFEPPHGNGRGALPSKKEADIDIKGHGGYVVGPGAVFTDGSGSYTAHGCIADATDPPEWLRELLRPVAAPAAVAPITATIRPEPVSDERLAAYGEAALQELLNELAAAVHGERNETANRIGFRVGQLVGAGCLTRVSALAALEQAALASWGLSPRDKALGPRGTFARAVRDGERNARGPDDTPAPVVEIDLPGTPAPAELLPAADSSLPLVCAAELHNKPILPRGWHVPELIPQNQPTILGGDGATGKSLLALQLAASTALGRPWIGFEEINFGPVIYLGAEDDIEELHRRLAQIVSSMGASLADARDLHLVPLAGEDAVLASVNGRSHVIEATKLWKQLEATVEEIRPTLVILDTLADLFAGEENQRAQARQFIGLLRGLAIRNQLAIVLLAHPSLSGISSGSGTSGSTGWSNSVRSRLYLERVHSPEHGGGSVELDETLRNLTNKKTNYGPKGTPIRLKWVDGVFERQGSAFGLDSAERDVTAELTFMQLLRLTESQGIRVNAKSSASYAPAVFAGRADANGITRRAFKGAMERLLTRGEIRITEVGPPSRRVSYLTAYPSDDGKDCGE